MRCANVLKTAVNTAKGFVGKHVKKVGAVVSAGVMMAVSAVNAFAAETGLDATEATNAAKSVLASVTSVLNITNIAAILAACMGSATILFLAWWGVRKVVKVTVNAFARGKLSI